MREDEQGEGEERESASTRQERGGHGVGGVEGDDCEELIARSLWGGRDHPNPSVAISPSSPV